MPTAYPAPPPFPSSPCPVSCPIRGLNATTMGFSFLPHRAYGKRCFQVLVGHFIAFHGYHLNAGILAPSAPSRAIDTAFQPSKAFPRYFPCTGFILPCAGFYLSDRYMYTTAILKAYMEKISVIHYFSYSIFNDQGCFRPFFLFQPESEKRKKCKKRRPAIIPGLLISSPRLFSF